ncbi:unannotated protein [freshwater metagenome]|uniref:Unannotated protein n=1 Tax=freshwater metagenome TaxID=449393 RepID=A0A6J6WE57_9ZZZZ
METFAHSISDAISRSNSREVTARLEVRPARSIASVINPVFVVSKLGVLPPKTPGQK